jgi:cobalt-zinc-cadmium efflux system membrane fusion protein
MQGSDVVFVREGEEYYVRPVTLGERDARSVEILDGVAAGEEIVVEQSYLIKANIEKSTVEED